MARVKSRIAAAEGGWTFHDARVADRFEEHVREQLPWLDLVLGAIRHIAWHYVPPRGAVLDLGASTGNVGRAIAPVLEAREAILLAVESSEEMAAKYQAPGTVIIADGPSFLAESNSTEKYDLIVMNLFLMFVPPARRRQLLRDAIDALRSGGAIVVVDKTEAARGYPATVLWRLALAGKRANGAGAEEIIDKELSLAGVQRPIDPAILPAGAVEWMRFGDFAGWLIEKREGA